MDALVPELKAGDRDGAILELVQTLTKAGKLPKTKVDEVAKALMQRETEASTGIGRGVAVPHVKHPAVKQVVAAVGCCGRGIDFTSLDKQPVYTVILLLSPTDKADRHLQAMECIFRNLQKDDFRRFLRQAQTVEQVRETIDDADASNT
ncbi:MAG: PTS sugar transporter subunit IIA [Phycisphaerae bacterium]|nr:PTS sugar transporter subunit IIA [Phycisphaerae bacterium]